MHPANLHLFPLLLLLTSSAFIIGSAWRRTALSPIWWIALLSGAGLAFLAGRVTAAPTGGVDFVGPLLVGMLLAATAPSTLSWQAAWRRWIGAGETTAFVLATLLVTMLAHQPDPQLDDRLVGIWKDPNVNALLLVAPLVWGAALLQRVVCNRESPEARRTRYSRWLLLAVIPSFAVLCGLMIGTASRAGLLGAAIGCLYYFCRMSKNPWRLASGAGAIAGLMVLVVLRYEPFANRLDEMLAGVDLAIRHRWIQMRALLGFVAAHPLLGGGWERLQFAWYDYLRPSNMSTRYGGAPWLLEIGGQAGLAALWLLLSLVLLGFTRSPRSRLQQVGAAAMFALAIGGLSQGFISYPLINAVFFFVLGLALAPGGPRDGRTLMRSLAGGGAAAIGTFAAGIASLPPTWWRETPGEVLMFHSRGEPAWVVVDCRAAPDGLGSRAFYRHLAETGGVYVRVKPPGEPHVAAARRLANTAAAALIRLQDSERDGRAPPHGASEAAVWDAVVTIHDAPPWEDERIEAVSTPPEAPDHWAIWARDADNLSPLRHRFVATLIAQIAANAAERRGHCALTEAEPPPAVNEEASLQQFSRAGVEAFLRARHPDADAWTVNQEACLAWKVRDRFYRNIDHHTYVADLVVSEVNGAHEPLGWRKRFFFHHYPLVYGMPDEREAVQFLLDNALWTRVTAGADNPWRRGVYTIDDFTTYVVLACRAVGIAARRAPCDFHPHCLQYYTDKTESWECLEVEPKWQASLTIETRAYDDQTASAADAP